MACANGKFGIEAADPVAQMINGRHVEIFVSPHHIGARKNTKTS
jgi:hypothetical protein